MKVSIVGSLRDREVACSASDRQGSNFESCVWRTVSSQSSHHPQEVLLAQFSLYVHKGGLKPDSFHFISYDENFIIIMACACVSQVVINLIKFGSEVVKNETWNKSVNIVGLLMFPRRPYANPAMGGGFLEGGVDVLDKILLRRRKLLHYFEMS